jgi:glutamate-1-semialdehyde 2,1-aminomutase
MFTLFFTDKQVVDFETAKTADAARYSVYFQAMLRQGVYLPPSQFEAIFISAAIDKKITDRILSASEVALQEVGH